MNRARSSASRRELEEHHFSPLVVISVSLAALFLSAYLPKLSPAFAICDLPFIAVMFFSISQRSATRGVLLGAIVGLLQDTLSNQYIGVNGIAKSLIGYTASSVGLRIDVENVFTRTLLNFTFSLLQSMILFLIERVLIGTHSYEGRWVHELTRAAVNAAVAVPIFIVLDRARSDT